MGGSAVVAEAQHVVSAVRAERRDEAGRNGNINWDDGFERLVLFLQRTLRDPTGLRRISVPSDR
ncbi:hypothetical protein ACIBUY_23135 [Streptomyces sp. NPDC050085]|uniref:hypothetical protein n=1 Tax=Streptomyces sp. NPDC050085 TaxID=3365600 RepID=UPI00379F6085